MKKIITYMIFGLLSLISCTEYDEIAIWNKSEYIDSRLAALEELCNRMNTNITSLQLIVEALQGNDYVTGVTQVVENGKTIGYTITFIKSGPVTIYHGKDGQQGTAPVIGIKQDGGIYYWTFDGEWLTDDRGDRVMAQGMAGKSAYELQSRKATGARSKHGLHRSTEVMATTANRPMNWRSKMVIGAPKKNGWNPSKAITETKAITASPLSWRSGKTVIGISLTTGDKCGLNWIGLRAIPAKTEIRCSAMLTIPIRIISF